MVKRPFFSLKWKAFIALSAVLVVANSGIAFLVHLKTRAIIESELADRRATQSREFSVVMARGGQPVGALTSFIPKLAGDGLGATADYAARLREILAMHGPMLGGEWGIEGVYFYPVGVVSGHPVPAVSWPSGRAPPPVLDLLQSMRRDESPRDRLFCDTRCRQVSAAPLMERGHTVGYLVLERSIGASLKDFYLLSGADVVLLRRSVRGGASAPADSSAWEDALVGMTRSEFLLPILGAVTREIPLEEIVQGPRRFRNGSAWYEIFALPMPTQPALRVLVINEVTAQVQAIREATLDSLLIGAGGLLLSELILLLLLSGPIRRILQIVSALPFLATRSFPQLRRALPPPATGAGRDELDVLSGALERAAAQIETLDKAHAAAEQALRESQHNLQLAQSMARVASWTGRPLDGSFRFDQAANRIHRVLAHISTWMEFLAFVHPDDKLVLLQAWRAGHPGSSMDVEFRLLIDQRVIDIHAMAEFDAVGPTRVLQAVGMIQDVSETRASQRALREHRDRLEQEVQARTVELVAARNVAERMAQTKGLILANTSHEIRAPLNTVVGLSEIGSRQARDRQTAVLFEQIRDAGEYLLHVVNDVLDLSKLEAGILSIERRPFDLRKIVRQSAEMLAPRAERKSLSLDVTIDADIPTRLLGDGFRVQQIVLNLLGNAVKFTERGRVTLSVSRDCDCYALRVVDTGIGMPAEQIDRLFKPFSQDPGAGARNREGAGLGLSISSTLAALMGGTIQVRSEPGDGSEFLLRLPLEVAPGSAPADEVVIAGPHTQAQRRLRGLHVLVADDVAVNRRLVETLLTAEGASVATVNDGAEAVQAVLGEGAAAFDVVLMDLEMPHLDGREATRRIREAGLQIPIIGLSAHLTADQREAALAAGMHEQLVKPVMQEVLVSTIRRYLHDPHGQIGEASTLH